MTQDNFVSNERKSCANCESKIDQINELLVIRGYDTDIWYFCSDECLKQFEDNIRHSLNEIDQDADYEREIGRAYGFP